MLCVVSGWLCLALAGVTQEGMRESEGGGPRMQMVRQSARRALSRNKPMFIINNDNSH